MEEALAYNYNVKIETSTKQLILEMIKGIRSVVRTGPEISFDQTADELQADVLREYVTGVIRLAEDNPDILSGVFNINELKKYLRYSQDYLEITNQLQELLRIIKQYQGVTNFFAARLANLVQEHMEMVAPGESDESQRLLMSVVHRNQMEELMKAATELRIVE
jgi:hypothetical protein